MCGIPDGSQGCVGSVVDPVVMTGWPLVGPIITAMGLVSDRFWGQACGVCGGSHSHSLLWALW